MSGAMSVQRLSIYPRVYGWKAEPTADGAFVRYADHARIVAEMEQAHAAALAEAVAAERDRIKARVKAAYEATRYEPNNCYDTLRAVMAAIDGEATTQDLGCRCDEYEGCCRGECKWIDGEATT